MIKINLKNNIEKKSSAVFILDNLKQLSEIELTKDEEKLIKTKLKTEKEYVEVNNLNKSIFILVPDKKNNISLQREFCRKKANEIANKLFATGEEQVFIKDFSSKDFCLNVAEGIYLTAYQFNKYFSKSKKHNLKNIFIASNITEDRIEELKYCLKGVYVARDIVNEPLSYMSAKQLSEEIKILGEKSGFDVEVFDKKRIEALKMGGLLAVNRGSIDPPSFSILKWEPENSINDKPYVLVGKGLVFDTGGINLKPGGSIETMKLDKAGAAAVVGAFVAIAKAKLPIKIIGLIPATDNRPGNNAYVPQDIINMYDGTTVEVLNTDAEGRLILADALAYAKKYKPELVIDLATLTGAAVVAIGSNATAMMGNNQKYNKQIIDNGHECFERLVELPLWEDYKEQLKSDFADIKNIGGREAGAITAGKFLQHFVDYNWIHLDIAGPAYYESKKSYHGVGGSGVGVRLLFNFFKSLTNNK